MECAHDMKINRLTRCLITTDSLVLKLTAVESKHPKVRANAAYT